MLISDKAGKCVRIYKNRGQERKKKNTPHHAALLSEQICAVVARALCPAAYAHLVKTNPVRTFVTAVPFRVRV